MCNVVSGGCASDEKCTRLFDVGTASDAHQYCTPVQGALPLGAECARVDGVSGFDTCADSFCSINASTPRCRAWCDPNVGCDDGVCTSARVVNDAVGNCEPGDCDYLDDTCPAGSSCKNGLRDISAHEAIGFCFADGLGRAGEACAADSDCVADHFCTGSRCALGCRVGIDDTCAGAGTCVGDDLFGLCDCTLFESGLCAGSCSMGGSDAAGYFPFCKGDGATPLGSACEFPDDCGPNTMCFRIGDSDDACTAICDGDHPCEVGTCDPRPNALFGTCTTG